MLGIDTSVAIPLLVSTHAEHVAVVRWWDGRELALVGHALPETYSVLTRLPGDLRLTPADAAELMAERFNKPLLLGARSAARVPALLAHLGVSGGAVYDALIGLAAAEHDVALASRDGRAVSTYQRVGANVVGAG